MVGQKKPLQQKGSQHPPYTQPEIFNPWRRWQRGYMWTQVRARPEICCRNKARIYTPTITHLGLDQDFVTGDLKGSSSMTVLFLRSSGDGFAGERKSLFSEAARSYNSASMTGMRSPTNCWLLPVLLISPPTLLADDRYPQPKSLHSFTPRLGENSEFLPLTRSPKVDGWPQKGNVPPREWCFAKHAQNPEHNKHFH